jgi:hypothetical protein
MNRYCFAASLSLALVAIAACGHSPPGCKPDEVIACPCLHAQEGHQTCNAAGDAYGACVDCAPVVDGGASVTTSSGVGGHAGAGGVTSSGVGGIGGAT